MKVNDSAEQLPAVVTSGPSVVPNFNYVEFTEKFSEKYKKVLPILYLKELANVYTQANEKSLATIRLLNGAISDFCEFSVILEINTLKDIDSYIILQFQQYLRNTHSGTKWRGYYHEFRNYFSAELPSIIWPQSEQVINPTVVVIPPLRIMR
jgi:hypothetical protein